MMEEVKKPEWIDQEELEEMLAFLDELRETAITNMLAAQPHIRAYWFERNEEKLSRDQAQELLVYWIKTFGARQEP